MIGSLIGLGIVAIIAAGWYLWHQRQLQLWGVSAEKAEKLRGTAHDQRYGGWDAGAYDARSPHRHPAVSTEVPAPRVPSADAAGWDPHAGGN